MPPQAAFLSKLLLKLSKLTKGNKYYIIHCNKYRAYVLQMHLSILKEYIMSTISVRLDSNDKHLFEEFCNDVGMSISTAVNMFIKNVITNQKLPFSVERDPFYSEENMNHLKKIINDIESGNAKLTPHELIED